MKLRLTLFAALAFAASAFAQTSSYYLPPGVTNIRAMITGGLPGPGNPSAAWQNFCATNRVGLAQLASDLPAIAAATGRPEIANAPLVLTGNSAASVGAVQTAISNPVKIVAIIGTHGAMLAAGNDGFNVNRGGDTPGDILTVDAAAVAGIPQVHTFANNDGFVNPITLQGLVEYGRSLGAPWYFLIHNDGNHTDSTTALNTSIMPWLAAILDLRLPASAGTGDGSVTLNAITESGGWLGGISTKAIASFASYAGDKAKANWFPNESVASAWAGYHFAPTYTIPAQPVIAPGGVIADLAVLDPNNNDTTSGVGWRINSNFKTCDQLFNDIKWWAVTVPPSIAGLDWIRPIVPGKKYSGYTVDPIATFRVTAEAEVFIAHSDSIATKPAWMAGFTDTGENLLVTSASLTGTTSLSVFKKSYATNSTVTLGGNGGAGGAMYLIFVKSLGGPALPSVSVTASDASATEGGDGGAFTITRTGDTTAALTVNFSVSGTAASGADFTNPGASIVIPAGQTTAVLTIAPIDDSLVEGTETVTLSVSGGAAYALGATTTATVNLADNDTSGLPVVTVTASDADAGEPGNGGAWIVARTGSTTGALNVGFTTTGTAARAVDYTLTGPSGTTLTIPAGQASRTITLNVINDTLVEGTETATCTLAANAAYTLGSPSSANITIADDDGGSGLPVVTMAATNPNAAEPGTSGAFTVTRTGATTNALTVNFAVSGTATSGADFTALGASVSIAAGQASATLTVTPIDDATAESSETVIVTLSANAAYTLGSPASATVNLADDDGTEPWIQQPAVTYATRGTTQLKMDIYLPANPPAGPRPVFIWIPGGGWASVTRANITDLYRAFTADGFAVVSMEHINSTEAKWPAQLQDCKAAVRWLRANAAAYNLDVTRFAVAGSSSGGHMAAMLGTTGGKRFATVGGTTVDFVGEGAVNATMSDAVQAVVPIMPPTHLLWADHFFTSSIPDKNGPNSPQSQLVGFPVQTVPELVSTAIPQTFIDAATPPFFTTQGTADTYVTFNASELLNQALVRAGRASTFWTTVGGGHDGSTRENTENVLLIRQFLQRVILGNTSNAHPVPSFTASVTSGPAPLTVSFNGSASSDPDGSVTKYAWSFGENAGANGATASFTYTTPGIYPVTLAVRDNLGASASVVQHITVLASTPASGTPPTVAVTNPTEGLVLTRPAHQLVQASVADADGTIVAVEFILDGQSMGFDRAEPFLYVWGELPVGPHTVSVRGYDSSGNTTLTPTPVTFFVEGPVALPTVTLSSADSTAAESGGTANTGSVTFTRSGATTNALTLNLLFQGDAVNGVDVTAVPASISIPAGQSAATITITPINDALIEGAETFAVSLAPSASYLASGTIGVLINDNDNAAPLTTTGVVFSTRVNGANTREIKLNVYQPATGSGPWPVLIYYPGGAWTSQNESGIGQLFLNLTAHGYAVVSANYVSSGFAKWPAQIQDGKAAVRWVRANAATYGFDPARIAVTGGSSGAHIAAYVGVSGGLKTARIGSEVVDLVGATGGNFEQSDTVQAVAPFFPPTDLLVMDHYPTPSVPDHNAANSPESGLIGAAIQTVPEKTATANPITLIRPGLPPFWITHGAADAAVNFNQSELLNAALVKAGQPVTFWPVETGGHGPGVSDSQEVIGLMKTFLDRTLKGITANARPIPAFTASTLTGTAPLTVDFEASESSDPDGVITKYTWATGDDSGATGPTVTHTYPLPGIYPVCLAVRDDQGGSASITANVIVHPANTPGTTPPTIMFTGPTDGFMYARTGDLLLQTTATANGGATVSSVEYFLNGQPVAWDSKPPFNTTLGSLPPGAYTASARVSDSTGAATLSSPIDFRVFGETEVDAAPSLAAGQFSATYFRFADGTLNYAFARSDDLENWTPFIPTQTILSDGPQVQWMRATDPLGVGGLSRRFLRIGVAPAP